MINKGLLGTVVITDNKVNNDQNNILNDWSFLSIRDTYVNPRFKNSGALIILNKLTYNIQDILNILILDKMWIDVGM